MNRISTLCAFLISVLSAVPANSQNTYVDHGSSSTYNLNGGDSLYIQNGNFTGNINTFNKNAKITVAAGANFQPSAFNNPKGILTVYGSAKFGSLNSNKNFDLENKGITEITGSTSMNGGEQQWLNYFGATLKFDGSITMNSDAVLVNDGTVTAGSDFTLNNGSIFTNNNILTTVGAFVSNGGQLNNVGKLETGGITLNSGTTFTNNCRLVINGSITNNNTTLINDGLIWIPSQYASAIFTNSGTIQNTANGKIKVRNFTNYGTLTGKGYYYFIGSSYNSGTVGVTGTTPDSIKIYDATRTSAPNIFDVQFGTVRPNVKFVAFPAPDTTSPYPSCSAKYVSMMITLPVKWNFFTVNLSNNIPALAWSSEQEAGTYFDVQRSYDGTNFSDIDVIAADPAQMNYAYNDKTVNTQAIVVYYRIKAIEPTGAQKLTEVKVVRLSNNKQGIAMQANPNPFASQFSISYQSPETGILTIKLYSLNGQQQAVKNVSVSKGLNSITMTEAGSLASGVYMVQVINNGQVVGSQKIVKQ